MGNLRNLVVGPLLILALQMIKYAGYLFMGPNTALVNATVANATVGVTSAARAASLHTHILFGWYWGFMIAQGGVVVWMIISAFKEEPYELGYGYG